MAGPAAGEGRGGGVATVEAAAGAAGGGARGAAAGGGRGGSSPLANARGTSWSPSSRTFPVAAGRGRGVVAAAKSGAAADDRSNANSSGGPSVAPEFKQAAQTVSSASAPAAGAPAACVAVDGGPCLRGKRAAGSPTSRRPGPGSEDDALISSRIAAIAQQLEWAAAASSPEAAAAPGAPQQLPARGPASGTAEPSGPNQDDFAVEVNDCFQKMYSGAYSVDLVVSLLQRLSQAPLGGRDSSLFLAMLRTLFFECRHFPRYPTQQLLLTAELFGKLIASQVLLHQPSASNSVAATNPSSLVIALRCVLEALRKGPNSKMFLFGVAALEQVLTRLYLFPDFLVSLSRLPPHFNLQCPHYTAYIENLLLLIPKRLHRSVYLDPATAAAALPPIPDPPASRGPGATNLTPAVVPAAAAPPGITPSGGALQQQPHQQQGLSHASAASSPTAATSGCLQTTKATSADAGVKPGEGGERGVTAGAGGVAGMEQQRRQQVQTAGLPQQQGPGKAPRQGGAATSADVGVGGTAVLGSGTATANPGDAAGGGGVLVLGGAGPRPFFAGGAAGMGTAGLCVTAGEQSMGTAGGACVGHGGQQPQQEQGTLPSGSSAGGATPGVLQQQQIPANGEPNTLVLGGGGLTTPPTAIGALLQGVGLGQVEGLMNDRELLAKLVLPPQWLAEQVIAACNSVCEANVDDKATALRHVLAPEHQAWLAFYLVKSRASKEPNLHAIFFLFVEKLEMPGLPEIVVSMSYDCINTLLKYLVEAKESSSYRTLLKNLGLWLGRITLGRNRPLMSKRLDLKTLLFRGYDEGHLVAVLPLVCKVLEGVRLSKVFKPPNPWTTAMLSLLAELQQLPNLRTNLIFEVEVLFKHLHINVQDYHGRSHHLARRAVPAASPDFVVRTAVSALDSTAVAGPTTAATAAAAPAGVKPLAAALNIPSATASLLTAGPPPGIGGPTATLGTAAAAPQQQPTTAAASPPPAGGLRPAAPTHVCATPTCAAQPRGQGATTPERGNGGAAGVAAEGGVATGAVCSRLLLAAAAGNTSTAQKLQQQQQQRGATNAAGGQLLESHQAGSSRVAMDAVTAGLRTAAAGGGGAGPAAAGQLQQQMLSQQQQVLAQRQQFPQLQSQGEGAGGAAAEAAGAAATLRGGASRAADETLLQHHQRLLAAASAAVGNGSAGEGVPSTSEDAESLGAAAGGRRDPRSLLLAAGIRGASAGETSSLFMSSGGGAGTYPQQPTAVERSTLVSSTTYTGEPQGSVPQAWPSLQEEQQGGADAAALGAGGNTSLLNLLQQQQQQQQQGGSGGAGATLLEQQPQVGAAGGPPPPPTQKSSAAGAAVQHHQATQGSPYRIAAAGGVAGGSSSSGVMEATAGGGGSPPSLFGGSTTAAEAFAAGAGTSSLMPSDSLLQNLAQNVVISPSIALLSLQPGLRPLVPLAVERAVREIISAVAERSVTISCVTTRELVCKDFCMEGEESLIKRAAHLMVASLAGSLALITCREPLRVSLTQNLRQLLQPVASAPECGDQVLVEQVLQIVSTDNLDLGCSVIEQAVVEKVLRDIEISIQPALQLRRQAKERGVPFVDTQYVNSGRWPMALPEPLKLHPLLNTRQLQVYKDFMLIGPLRKMHQQHVYGGQQQQQVQQQQPLQQQQRSNGCQQQQQQQMVGGQQQHGVGGGTAGGAGGGATSTAGSLASGSGRDSGEGAAGAVFGAAGGTLLSAAATASGRPPSATQQQQREAIQQMAATVAAARALNQQQQQQQKLMQLQQQGAPPGHSTDLADGLASTRQLAAATAGAAAPGLGAAAAGSGPQQQQTRSSLNAQQSSYGGTAGLNMQYQIHIPQYSGQEQSLSVLMLRLEGCLVQLRDVVRDIFNSPPVMPTPSTAHQFSYPAGCQMLALPVPLCSTSALLVFACLPSNHELFQLIASVSSVASSCSRMDEVAPALAHKLIKSVFEGAALAAHRGVVGSALRGVDPTGLYMEVFFAVLAALRRESEVVGKLAGEVLSISCASATLPPKRSNVAVAAGLMRYGLIDFSAFDGVLASHLEGGRNAPVVEFVLVLLKVLQDQHAVSPAVLPNTFKTLAAADALPPRVVQLRGWQCLSLTEARDKLLETFQQREVAENKDGLPYLTTLTQLMEDYCVPAYPVKVRCLAVLPEISVETQRLVRRIFEDWIRLCTVPATLSVVGAAAAAGGGGGGTAGGGGGGFSWMTPGTQQQQPTTQGTNLFVHRRLMGTSEGGGAVGGAAAGSGTAGGQQQPCGSAAWGEENASLHRAMFFQKVSQQGLLRMDEDTDRFFAGCVDVAVEKATVMLRVQAARNGNSGSKQQSAAAAVGKDCASSSAAEATKTLGAACDSCAGGKGVSTPHSKNRSSSSNTGERTPRQQQQAKVESETCEEGGEAAPTFMDKIGPGELSSSSTNEGQRTDSSLSSSSSGTGAGASQKPAAGHWGAPVAGKKTSTEDKGKSGTAESGGQLKTDDGAQEQQETKQQQEHQARSTGAAPEAADTDARGGEQLQQQTAGVLAVDPTMSAEALAAMETPPEETEAPLDVVPLDSLAKMIAAMMRFVDPQQVSPVLILQRALGVLCRHMHMQAEALGSSFNQRPYFRLLLSILLEVTSPAAFPLASSGAAATAGGGGAAGAAGSAAGGSGGSQQQQQQGSSGSDGENATAGAGVSSPRGGGADGGAADTAAAVAQQQLLLQQSILSFADHLALLCPMRLPAFAFAWLELVGHRTFLPLLLRGPSGMRGNPRSGWVALHKLLLLHFEFIHPFLATVSLSDSVRQLYKGTLRVLLVLLHDFPEYLCETYVDCCSVLPLNCVQLRNVILSAFPRNMRLPDPFLPNLRVDLLPEVKIVPRLLLTHSFYSVLLLHQRQKQQLLKGDVDMYWQSRDPTLLPRIRKKLLLPCKAEALKRGTKYDVPLFNAFLLYVATSVPEHDPRSCGSISSAVLPPGPLPPALDGSCSSSNGGAAAGERGGGSGSAGGYGADSSSVGYGCNSMYHVLSGGDISGNSNGLGPEGGAMLSPALEIILYLAKELDMEGRYLLMSAIANHLRYPNAHTHFFSNLLLWLFSESKEELVQEQITRVLLERLIVHRPHPWGLLITFIELIKNPRFAFWSCLFVSAAPEVEKLFQSVAHTCLGQSGAQQLQQQRQR